MARREGKAMFELTIKTENDAFTEGEAMEVGRILRRVAERVEESRRAGALMDTNGNVVGEFKFTD